MRKLLAFLATAALALPLIGTIAARPAQAEGPFCGIDWGSLPKETPELAGAPLVGARVGHHPCFDRLVFDLGAQPAPGYSVRYVDQVTAPGSGFPVPVEGGAALEFVVRAPAHDEQGNPTFPVAGMGTVYDLQGWPTLRDVRLGASFEGMTTFAVGVRGQLPFRVFTLDGPLGNSRVVLDVAHQW